MMTISVPILCINIISIIFLPDYPYASEYFSHPPPLSLILSWFPAPFVLFSLALWGPCSTSYWLMLHLALPNLPFVFNLEPSLHVHLSLSLTHTKPDRPV